METRHLGWLMLLWLFPLCASAGRVAIIIDDLGYNAEMGRRAAELPGNFTLAILPFTPHAKDLAERGQRNGKEIMVHAPMSNNRDLPLGKGALESGMTRPQLQQALEQMLADLPQARGLNNHMGSQLTRERQTMGWLMDELARRGLYFVDSRTSAESVALAVAEERQVASLKRDIFLDNQRDIGHIRQQLRKVLAMAQSRGQAVAIGHPYPETLAALEALKPLLNDYQVRLVSASTLMEHSTQISPPACQTPPVLLWRPVNPDVPAATPAPHFLPDYLLVMKFN